MAPAGAPAGAPPADPAAADSFCRDWDERFNLGRVVTQARAAVTGGGADAPGPPSTPWVWIERGRAARDTIAAVATDRSARVAAAAARAAAALARVRLRSPADSDGEGDGAFGDDGYRVIDIVEAALEPAGGGRAASAGAATPAAKPPAEAPTTSPSPATPAPPTPDIISRAGGGSGFAAARARFAAAAAAGAPAPSPAAARRALANGPCHITLGARAKSAGSDR